MNTETNTEYWQRCIDELGQKAHGVLAVTDWCYANPPHRPLPELHRGERTRQLWISQVVQDSLRDMGAAIGNGEYTSGMMDALGNAMLTQALKDHAPEIWAFHQRYQDERADIIKRRAELRRNEPTLAVLDGSGKPVAGALKVEKPEPMKCLNPNAWTTTEPTLEKDGA